MKHDASRGPSTNKQHRSGGWGLFSAFPFAIGLAKSDGTAMDRLASAIRERTATSASTCQRAAVCHRVDVGVALRAVKGGTPTTHPQAVRFGCMPQPCGNGTVGVNDPAPVDPVSTAPPQQRAACRGTWDPLVPRPFCHNLPRLSPPESVWNFATSLFRLLCLCRLLLLELCSHSASHVRHYRVDHCPTSAK